MILWILLLFLVTIFGGIVLFGAPYLPTRKAQQQAALDLLNLPKGATFIELGCGDGRMLIAAAKRGLHVTGYELNPVLALIAWARTRKYSKQIKVHFGDFWRADLSRADGVYVFLIERFMPKLDSKLAQASKLRPIKLASYAFTVPGRKADGASQGVFLYTYP